MKRQSKNYINWRELDKIENKEIYLQNKFQQMHTAQLMNQRQWLHDWTRHSYNLWREEAIEFGLINESYDNALKIITNELNKREHIPNKQEAKAIRQMKAKRK